MDIKTALRSLMMLGIVAALVGGATYAVFSDTETSVGNEMVAGTIDFSVDDENPWTETGWADALHDMKPCYVRSGEFVIKNVGTNEMDIWKKLTIVEGSIQGGTCTEPECIAEGGTYNDETDTCTPGTDVDDDISDVVEYGMSIVMSNTSSENVLEIIPLNDRILASVSGEYILLGRLYPGETMTVTQTYHLSVDVGNEAQGDKLTFNVELYAEQVGGSASGPNTHNVDGTPK